MLFPMVLNRVMPQARGMSVPLRAFGDHLLQAGGSHHRNRVREKVVKEQEARQRLTENIELRQSAIKLFLRQERPRRNRLATTSVVGSALAAGFTAGPAFGGPKFAAGSKER
jgi:dephospho-CoA kinase